jgi:hypothetical protein
VSKTALARLTLLASAVLALHGSAQGAAVDVVGQQAHWASADAGVRLELQFPVPRAEDVDGQVILRLENEGFISDPGAPDLPLVNRLVRIPDRSDVILSVVDEQWLAWDVAHVRPVQERLHTAADLPLPWAEQPAIYGGTAWYPAETVTLGEPMILRDQRLVKVSVAPVRWNPATREIERLASLELRLDFAGENPVNQILHPMPASPLMHRLVGGEIIAPPAGTSEGAMDAIEWASADTPLTYVVYTPATALENVSFQAWLDWKFRKGHAVKVITGSDISWTNTAIRNSIISEYNGATPPDYVMLVGDVDGGSYVTPTSSSQYDHSYAAIAGNDILADVVVGRISARSSTQLSTIFNKILAYEQNPDLDNPGWLHRASFLTGSGHCGLSMSQLSRAAAFSLVDHYGYTQIDTAFCASSPNYVSTWYNAGTSFHNYRGWIGMEGLSTSQIMGLAQGRRTPISVIFTCSSGDFADSWSEPAYTEAFLRAGTANTPGGGAAAMGFCTPQTHTAYNNVVCGGFWYSVLDLHIRQVGTAMFRGKYELFRSLPSGDANISNFSYWANLMGDPGMNVWVGEPEVLQFEETPVAVNAGDTRLALRVVNSAGTAVEGAVVCASQPDGIQVLGLTGPDGRIVLTLPELDGGQPLWLTASRDDHVPVMQDYTLTNTTIPGVGGLEFASGLNAFAVPGAATSLNLSVTNTLAGTLGGGTVTLALDEGVGTVQQATSVLPSLAPGATGELVTPLQFTLGGNQGNGSPVWLNLTLAWSGGNSVMYRLPADARYPLIELVNPNVSGLALEPGDSGNLQLSVRNAGQMAGAGLSLQASFPVGAPFTTPATPVVLDLAAGATSDQVFIPVSMSNNAFRGGRSILHVEWTQGAISGSFEVPVASSTGATTDPTGPDAYGYFAWENGDIGPLAMEYAWVEIAPAAGGSGTVLNLTDLGDEQDDATMVTLPFEFTLYGESYTEMSVCSNGFVSFGPDSHLETDFRNHYLPGAMGPEPMLAVMWDDHKITSGAQVCVQYQPENHLYVVEWYRVRGNSTGGPNSFQLLLLDPEYYVTPSGDADFIYQYNLFANNQNNGQDFPYCTIGVEDHTGTRGLTLTNYNTWFPTATSISSTRAIRFSTQQQAVSGGVLDVLTTGVTFNLSNTEPMQDSDVLQLANTGTGLLNWQARVEIVGDWPPAAGSTRPSDLPRDNGGPDSFGYRWIDSLEEDGPEYNWVDTSAGAEPVTFVQNDQAEGLFAIGFDMPFYGSLYDSLYISPNGFISFTDNANYWNNSVGLPNSQAPDNAVCGWWDDLLSNESLEGHVTRYSSGDSLVVSWLAAPHYNPGQYGGPFTFQIILEANGRITLQYGDMSSDDPNSDSGTFGLQGPAADVGFSVRSMLISRSNYTVSITPPFWLDLPVATGLLGEGQSVDVPLNATNTPAGMLLPEGQYEAMVVVTSGDQTFEVPVTLSIGEVSVPYGDDNALPQAFSLGAVWPNPFNPSTRVSVRVADERPFALELYNLRGQRVQTLFSGSHTPGTFEMHVDGSALASGVYLLSLKGDGFHDTKKIALVR